MITYAKGFRSPSRLSSPIAQNSIKIFTSTPKKRKVEPKSIEEKENNWEKAMKDDVCNFITF